MMKDQTHAQAWFYTSDRCNIYHQLLHSACTQGAVSIAKHLRHADSTFVTKSTVAGIISDPLLCYWNPNQLKHTNDHQP